MNAGRTRRSVAVETCVSEVRGRLEPPLFHVRRRMRGRDTGASPSWSPRSGIERDDGPPGRCGGCSRGGTAARRWRRARVGRRASMTCGSPPSSGRHTFSTTLRCWSGLSDRQAQVDVHSRGAGGRRPVSAAYAAAHEPGHLLGRHHLCAASDDARADTERLAAVVAGLAYRGYCHTEYVGPRRMELQRYELASLRPRWRDLDGYHTRFGDVREVLAGVEKRCAGGTIARWRRNS